MKVTLDPEVEALIQEALRDPEARLLSADPATGRSKAVGVRGLSDPLSPRSPELSKLERHMVQKHRDLIALLLRQAYIRSKARAASTRYIWHRSVTVDRELDVPKNGTWARRVNGASRLPVGESLVRDGVDLLVEGQTVTSESLALAALRLAPCDQARLYLADCWIRKDRWAEAFDVLDDVLANGPSDLHRSYVWEKAAMARWGRGEVEQALEAYRIAASTSEARPVPVGNWFLLACYLANREEALSAAQRLEDWLTPDHYAITALVDGFKRLAVAGSWRPDDAARSFVTALLDQLGPVARRLTDAF